MKPSVKAVLSSLLILLFLFLVISGAMLYFGKTGVVLGFARYFLRGAHALVALLMCILVIVHLFLNRRVYFGELRSAAGKLRNKTKGEQSSGQGDDL